MGQHCGPIRQVALPINDGYGIIHVNYVTNYDASIMLAEGDSGAAVISLHTQGRAWAVGIIQAFYNNQYNRTGAACGARFFDSGLECGNNFLFTNVDYALSGFTAHGINYY